MSSPDHNDSAVPDDSAAAALPRGDSGRIVVIDILRGLAILWVMTFHLWTDMTLGVPGASVLYDRLGDRVAEGDAVASFTALTDLILGSGYQGVAVFMMLSGLSLTLNAQGRGRAPFVSTFIVRCRRILPAYWGGVLIGFAAVACVAMLQYWVDGESWVSQWNDVRIATVDVVPTDLIDPLWGLSIVGPLVRTDATGTWTVASLWFVPLLLQYYVLFPVLLRVLTRLGPWTFAALAILLTAIAQGVYTEALVDWLPAAYDGRTHNLLAPFRMGEFMLGMSLGWLLVHRRQQVNNWVSSPFDVVSFLAFAAVLQWMSLAIDWNNVALNSFSIPLSQAALALYAVPLLFKTPGRLEVSVAARLLVGLGIISLTALIVNDQMRYVASFLRAQDTPGILWWPFVVAVYIPGATVLFAWPLARIFGLMPDQKRPSPAPRGEQAGTDAPPDFAPAPASGGS